MMQICKSLIRRPLCLFCLWLAAVILILNAFHLPLSPVYQGKGKADEAARQERVVTLVGKVRETELREGFSYCYLTNVQMSCAEVNAKTTEPVTSNTAQSQQYIPIGSVRLTLEDSTYYASGNLLLVKGSLLFPPVASNPGQFDTSFYYQIKKINYLMKYPSVTLQSNHISPWREKMLSLRRWFQNRIQNTFEEEDASVLSAMLIGDKTLLSPEQKYKWQMGGISHMLAISGLHLTLIGMLFYRLLRRCYLPSAVAATIAMLILFLYGIFTGMSISTMRAFFMFAAAMGAPITGRTYDMPSSLAAAVIIMLLDNPYYLFYGAFQMSVAAVFICCLIRGRSKLMSSLLMYLGMLPIILYSFFEIPLYSIFVNFITVPLLPFLLGFGFIGSVSEIALLAFPAKAILSLIRHLLYFFGGLPFSSFILGKPSLLRMIVYYLLLLLWSFIMKHYRSYKRRILFLLACPLLVLVLRYPRSSSMEITFLDVGQGDSCYVTCPKGTSLLIDGGSSDVREVGTYRILPAIKSAGIAEIDYLIVTHTDGDHISGIKEILTGMIQGENNLKVDTILLPELRSKPEGLVELEEIGEMAGCRIVSIRMGDLIRPERNVTLSFLNPNPELEEREPDLNAQCIVTSLSYGNFDILMTGDVSGKGEQSILQRLQDDDSIHYEILKVAHHGSNLSTSRAFLEEIQPEVGIISVGANNSYGHPGRELIQRLKEMGTTIYRTDEQGAITVKTDGISYGISTYLS